MNQLSNYVELLNQRINNGIGSLFEDMLQSHDICSGSPVLEGTRTRVIDIAIEYTMLGRSPDEIIDAHPYLDLARVHDALSYYYERWEKLDVEIQTRIQDIEELRAKIQSKVWKTV